MKVHCPKCGEDLSLVVEAELPKETDLTLQLSIAEGQLMRLDTLGGLLNSFSDLQRAVGESLGCDTQVFLAGLEMKDGNVSITTRILNGPPADELAAEIEGGDA